MHLDGQAFGDLFWYQGDTRLLLVLAQCNRSTHLPYPIYDVGVDDGARASEAPPLRLVKIDNFRNNISTVHTNFRAPLRTILLVRHRPGEIFEEPMMIHLPLNHSFPPSIRLPERLLRSLLTRPTVTEVSITNAQLPWSGDPPLMITYRVQLHEDVLYATALFGLCTSHSTNGEVTGSLWATFRGSQSGWDRTERGHRCTSDHVLNWSGLMRRFVVKFHADDEAMGDHIAKWMFDMEFTKSVHTGTLVLTNIDHILRVLLKESGYYDFLEERDERIRRTQAALLDAHPKEFSVATGGNEPGPSKFKTTTLQDYQSSSRSQCLGCLFHRLACTCSPAPSAHEVQSCPLSISVFIKWVSSSLHVDDPIRHRLSLAFIDPAMLHWNGPRSEDLSLLLP